jgi:hypothetical protein
MNMFDKKLHPADALAQCRADIEALREKENHLEQILRALPVAECYGDEWIATTYFSQVFLERRSADQKPAASPAVVAPPAAKSDLAWVIPGGMFISEG